MAGMWFVLATRRLGSSGLAADAFTLFTSTLSALVAYRMGLASAGVAGEMVRAVTMPRGSSTPYEEQFSYLVELRRLVEQHPVTDTAAGARRAIARVKAQRAAERDDG
jgi:hypothetical protein